MNLSTKIILVAVLFAVPALILGHVLWPDAPGALSPTPSQLPWFVFLSVLEAAAFGAGISFLFFGWPMLKHVPAHKRGEMKLVFLSVAWLLVSWWPHDNMHRNNGEDMAGLLRIEYIFHFTLIVTSCIIARYLWRTLREYR